MREIPSPLVTFLKENYDTETKLIFILSIEGFWAFPADSGGFSLSRLAFWIFCWVGLGWFGVYQEPAALETAPRAHRTCLFTPAILEVSLSLLNE